MFGPIEIKWIKRFAFMCILVTQAGTGYAVEYYFAQSSIQHRVHQTEKTKNVLSFGINNGEEFISDESAIVNVDLYFPDHSKVTLTNHRFESYPYVSAGVYIADCQWWDNPKIPFSEYMADIVSPLVTGTYRLVVFMSNGQTIIDMIDFDFLLDLPVVPKRSFYIRTDACGNVHWWWKNPDRLATLSGTYDLKITPCMVAYYKGTKVSVYHPRIPVEMEYGFATDTVYQGLIHPDLIHSADEIRFFIKVRTTNDNAHSYSGSVIVRNLSEPVCITPRRGVAVIPLSTE